MKKILFLSFILLAILPFQGRAQFVLNGSATTTLPECSDSTTTYLLTPASLNQSGQIWYATQVSLANKFDIQFEMFLGTRAYTTGADGICFVFQQQSVNAGSSGGGLGYAGITPSLAVEFDTYQNSWDPAYCHTAIEKDGDVQHNDHSGNNLAGPVQLDPTHPLIPDGNWHHMEIIWNPATDSIKVYYDCIFRISFHGDIIDSIFGGNPLVYWGFTAGTGSDVNQQEVCVAYSYLNALRDTAICIGNSVTLTAKGGDKYVWGPSKGLNKDTGSTVIATPDTTTTYTVSIINACGIVSKDSITITVDSIPKASMGVPTNLVCNGVNDGSATVTMSGGTQPYSYNWMPSGGTNATGTGLSAGTYTVIATDKDGCSGTNTLTVTITQPPAITGTATITKTSCSNAAGAISIGSIGGGEAPYTYLWSPTGKTTTSISGLSAGTYIFTITDAKGCVDSIKCLVGLDSAINVTVSGNDSSCKGQNVTLTASGATTYKWSNSATSSSVIVAPTANTTYWVIGTIGVCKDSVPYTVNIYSPLVDSTLKNDSICPGKPITLNVEVFGGKPVYTYTWNNGITSNSPGPIVVYPTSSTTYSVAITDGCNYLAEDSMHVKVFPIAAASFFVSPDPSYVPGEPITFNNTTTGAIGNYWTFGDGTNSTQISPIHEFNEPGTYIVILTTDNKYGCLDTVTKEIDVEPLILIPNVFTPNGDGKNDILYFTIGGTRCFTCDIYDRWGNLVYESNNEAAGWDGKIRQTGQLASDGAYYYVINYCDYKDVSHKLDGFVQLVR